MRRLARLFKQECRQYITISHQRISSNCISKDRNIPASVALKVCASDSSYQGRMPFGMYIGALTFMVGIKLILDNEKTIALADDSIRSGASDADILNRLKRSLAISLRPDQIETNVDECISRGKPWNSYHSSPHFPNLIVYPESTGDVAEILKTCNDLRVPIIPFGGGTSIEGHTLAMLPATISLDFNRMKKILDFNKDDLDIRVQAGIGYIELNEILRPHGLWFPLDPGPGASVGGMCACRCSGSTAVRYGSMRDNVLNITAVLPTGMVFKTGSRARKSSAGYDLTRLLIGSEGTLAAITEVTLKLHPLPKFSSALRVSFPSPKDDSSSSGRGVYSASLTAAKAITQGINIGRCELMDYNMIRCINLANPLLADQEGLWPEEDTLLFEITGHSQESVESQIEIVKEIARANGGTDFLTAVDPASCKRIWQLRKESLWSCMSVFTDREPLITDVCVPISALPQLIFDTRVELEKSTLPAPIVAHAGDGNFHVLLFFKPSDPFEAAEAKRLSHLMADKALAMGGTCTGEHGVGVGKQEHLRLEMGPGSMTLMESIKTMMDPHNILNPGKVLTLGSGTSGSSSHSCMQSQRDPDNSDRS